MKSDQRWQDWVILALGVWALWLLLGGGTLVQLLLYVALIALGADFVVTGARGKCPLYKWLGWSTAGT